MLRQIDREYESDVCRRCKGKHLSVDPVEQRVAKSRLALFLGSSGILRHGGCPLRSIQSSSVLCILVRQTRNSPLRTLQASRLCCEQVYNVSSGKSVPEWISEAKRKSFQKSEEYRYSGSSKVSTFQRYWRTRADKRSLVVYRRRLELIQDLEFPEAAHRLKATTDQKHILASGIHPPRVSLICSESACF